MLSNDGPELHPAAQKICNDEEALLPKLLKLRRVAVLKGLSQTFSDQDASRMRREHDLTSGYGLGFQKTKILPMVRSTQVRQSAISLQIRREKTLRQVPQTSGTGRLAMP